MPKLFKKLKAYIELMRVHNVIASLFGVLVGFVSVTRCLDLNVWIPMIPVALVSAAGYVINDYYDYRSDLVNKPWRPIPSGRVTLKEAYVFSIILYVLGVASSIYLGLLLVLFTLANALMTYYYSKSIKETGLLGNVVVSLGGANTIIYGGLAAEYLYGSYGNELNFIIPALFAFTLLLLREIVKGIEDYYADEVRNVRTLVRVAGYKVASLASIALTTVLVILTVITILFFNYSWVFLILAIVTISTSYIATTYVYVSRNLDMAVRRAGKSRSLLKVSIFTGLLAFLLNYII